MDFQNRFSIHFDDDDLHMLQMHVMHSTFSFHVWFLLHIHLVRHGTMLSVFVLYCVTKTIIIVVENIYFSNHFLQTILAIFECVPNGVIYFDATLASKFKNEYTTMYL